MLIDVVSKNGNLLLSVPLRGDGSLDSDVRGVVQEIGAWLEVNREAIVGTRPWRVFGEGPAPLSAEGFNESKGKPFSAQDVRFTEKNGIVYATIVGGLLEPLPIRALGLDAGQRVNDVKRLGSAEPVRWQQQAAALVLEPSAHPTSPADEIATVFKLTFRALR